MNEFAQLLKQDTNFELFNQSISLIPAMGGVSKLSEPSRDLTAIQSAANHDFSVSMKKVYLSNGLELPNRATAINASTGELLGGNVVTDGYNPLQPSELYSLANHLLSLDNKMAVTDVVTMGNLIGLQINRGNWSPTGELADTLQDNILLGTTFDGSKPTFMKTTTFRTFCSNQYPHAKKLFSIRHTRNSDVRIGELKHLLSQVTTEIDKTNAEIQALVYKSMTNGQASQWFQSLILGNKEIKDLTPRAKSGLDNKVSDFERLLTGGAGYEAGHNTRYAAFNALTNYCTHERTTRVSSNSNESDVRWESNTFGSSADFAISGFNQLVNM